MTPVSEGFATSVREVAPRQGVAGFLRRNTRRLALEMLYPRLAIRERLRPLREPHLRIVLYHFVFDGEVTRFDEHLAYFKEHYAVLPLNDALQRLRHGSLGGPTLAITFDDGYRNNRTNAAQVLAKHGLVACFYVTTGFVSLPAGDREVLAAVCRQSLQLRKPVENMRWDDVRWLAHAGHEIGSHTVTHAVLSQREGAEAEREIVESKRVIEREVGQRVRHFAVPYGLRRHFDPRIDTAVRDAGYESCALTMGGPNLPGHEAYLLRRDSLAAGSSLRELRIRLLRTARWPTPAWMDGGR